jgi:hypothetical protein
MTSIFFMKQAKIWCLTFPLIGGSNFRLLPSFWTNPCLVDPKAIDEAPSFLFSFLSLPNANKIEV